MLFIKTRSYVIQKKKISFLKSFYHILKAYRFLWLTDHSSLSIVKTWLKRKDFYVGTNVKRARHRWWSSAQYVAVRGGAVEAVPV